MRVPFIIAAATTLVLALPAQARAVTASATRPATVAGSTALYARDVKSAVTVSGAATITLTNLAYRHPEVGLLTLQCQVLQDPDSSQNLLVYTAEPGSAAAEKLTLLASWAAPLPEPGSTSAPDRPGR